MLWRRLLVGRRKAKDNPFTPFDYAIYARYVGTAVELFTVTYTPPGPNGGTGSIVFSSGLKPANMSREIVGRPMRNKDGVVAMLGREFALGTGLGGALLSTDKSPNPASVEGPQFSAGWAQETGNITTLNFDLAVTALGSAYVTSGKGAYPYVASNDKQTFAKPTDPWPSSTGYTYAQAYAFNGNNYGQITWYPQKATSDPTYPRDANGNPRAWDGTAADAENFVGPAAGTYASDGSPPGNKPAPNGADYRGLTPEMSGVWVRAGGKLYNQNLGQFPPTFLLARGPNGPASFSGTITQGVHSIAWSYTLSWATITTHAVYTTQSFRSVASFGNTSGETKASIQVVGPPSIAKDDAVDMRMWTLTETGFETALPDASIATTFSVARSTFAAYTWTVIDATGKATLPAVISGVGSGKADNSKALNYWGGVGAASTATGYSMAAFDMPAGGLQSNKANAYDQTRYLSSSGNPTAVTAPSGYNSLGTGKLGKSSSAQDTCGTALVTSAPAQPQFGSTTATVAMLDFFAGIDIGYTFSNGPTAWINTGDDFISLGGVQSSYRVGSITTTKTQTYGSVLQTGSTATVLATTAGTSAANNNLTYYSDATKKGDLTLPALWAVASPMAPVPLDAPSLALLSPLPGDGTVTCLGTSIDSYALVGRRGDTAYLRASIVSLVETVMPVSTIPGQTIPEAQQTWNGAVYKHIGLRRLTTTYYTLIAIKGRVATIQPYNVSKTVSYFEIGQQVDGNGVGQNVYANWTTPGAARSPALSTTTTQAGFGAILSPADIITVDNVDYAVDAKAFCAIDVLANSAQAAQASSVKRMTVPPTLGSKWWAAAIPNLAAILLVDSTNSSSYLSTDLGTSWPPVVMRGLVPTAATGGVQGNIGSPLFRY